MKDYLLQNHPGATGVDLIGGRTIVAQEFPFLLGTLTYRSIVPGTLFSVIPNNLRHSIAFRGGETDYEADFQVTMSLAELAGKRITLSFSPATNEDGVLIQSFGDAVSLPAYLIKLKPELKIEGETKASGNPIPMGRQANFTMTFVDAHGGHDAVSNEVIAGEYYAVVVDSGQITQSFLSQRIDKIKQVQTLFQTDQYDRITLDDVFGESLSGIGLAYFSELDFLSSVSAKSMRVVTSRLPSEGIVSQGLRVSYLFSIPRSAKAGSLNIDVDRDLHAVLPLDGDTSKVRSFALSAGMKSSTLEHKIFEQVYGIEGMSAVKALSVANSSGIPIYGIDAGNINNVLPVLEVSEEIKSDIINQVNAGNTITIPRTNINYLGWTGIGYIASNPETGAGGYMISGGFAGGELHCKLLDFVSSIGVSTAYAGTGSRADQYDSVMKTGEGLSETMKWLAFGEFADLISFLCAEAFIGLVLLGVGPAGWAVYVLRLLVFLAIVAIAIYLFNKYGDFQNCSNKPKWLQTVLVAMLRKKEMSPVAASNRVLRNMIVRCLYSSTQGSRA